MMPISPRTPPTARLLPLLLIFAFSCSEPVFAQSFSSGSDGSDGALVVTGTTVLQLPEDGIFNFTTVTIEANQTLRFERNALNTPAYVLATGDIVLEFNSRITLTGLPGTSVAGGTAGPGGFDGGAPSIAGSPPGNGQGPGGGGPATDGGDPQPPGRGSYKTLPPTLQTNDGVIYGSELLVPLVGGSGGGGALSGGAGGCGGGGAVLLASDTRVQIDGIVFADVNCALAAGSGGAIRLVAPVVTGNGELRVNGGPANQRYGGDGRVRIDTIDRSGLEGLDVVPASSLTLGAFMVSFPDVVPRLDVISVAGQAISEGESGPVDVVLALNAQSSQVVTVQATDFEGLVPVDVVITPDSGERVIYPVQIDMSNGNPTTVDVVVEIPENVPVRVNAWTR